MAFVPDKKLIVTIWCITYALPIIGFVLVLKAMNPIEDRSYPIKESNVPKREFRAKGSPSAVVEESWDNNRDGRPDYYEVHIGRDWNIDRLFAFRDENFDGVVDSTGFIVNGMRTAFIAVDRDYDGAPDDRTLSLTENDTATDHWLYCDYSGDGTLDAVIHYTGNESTYYISLDDKWTVAQRVEGTLRATVIASEGKTTVYKFAAGNWRAEAGSEGLSQ